MLRQIKLYIIFFPVLLQGMAAYDVMIDQAVQIAQVEALRAVEVAIDMRHMRAFAQPDAMLCYDYAYENMQGQQVAQESVQDVPCFTVPGDYLVQPVVATHLDQVPFEAPVPLSISMPFAAEDVRERALGCLQAPFAYRQELLAFDGMPARNGLRERTPFSPSPSGGRNRVGLPFDVGMHHNQALNGCTRKNLISAIRCFSEAKKAIGCINQRFLDICRAFENAYAAGDFNETLRLLARMRSDCESLEMLGPVSYLLKPEIANTIKYIEWPLLEHALGNKDCLKQRDYEQIAWAIESHFEYMHRYTHDAKIALPDGVLKNVIDDHHNSRFGWFGRTYKNARYYPVHGARAFYDIDKSRDAYQEMLSQNRVQEAVQPQAVQPQIVQSQTAQTQAASSSSDVETRHTVDYAQLLDQVLSQNQAIVHKKGNLTEYNLSREVALVPMVQGDLEVRSVCYTLSPQAITTLERAGIDVSQFTEYTGNLIQQDTHAKLVNALNSLADARPFTLQGRLIKNGALGCAQAGNLLNREGYVREAMLHADLCTFVVEKLLRVADRMNPFVGVLDVTDAVLRAASAHEAAQSLEILRTNVEQFRTGFVLGAVNGATDVKGIYEGLCNTVETIGHFIKYVGEQEALADALEFGRYNDAQHILDANHERAVRIAVAADHITQHVSDFIDHMPDMTTEEWRQAGFNTGEFVGREAVQMGIYKIGMTGLSRIGQGIATSIRDFETLGRELALSAQLSGNPVAPSIAEILRRGYHVENVFLQNGSRHISGPAARYPQFFRRIASTETGPIAQVLRTAAATSSLTTGRAGVFREFGKHLGRVMAEAQPGFLQLPGSSTTEAISVTETALTAFENKYGHYKQRIKEIAETGEKIRVPYPSDWQKWDEWAEDAYAAIRARSDDVAKIAHHTGMSEAKINRIKYHLFYDDTHVLSREKRIGCFSPDVEIAAAWDRLAKGDFVNNDIKLLEHEYFESRFEKIFKTDYDVAHKAAQSVTKGRLWHEPKYKE